MWRPYNDSVGFYPTEPNGDPRPSFGSAHSGAMNMAFCDGSIRNIGYDADERVYFFLGGRDDDGTQYAGLK